MGRPVDRLASARGRDVQLMAQILEERTVERPPQQALPADSNATDGRLNTGGRPSRTQQGIRLLAHRAISLAVRRELRNWAERASFP